MSRTFRPMTLTFLLTDIEGSTHLWEPTAMRWKRLLLAMIAWCRRWLPTMGGAW